MFAAAFCLGIVMSLALAWQGLFGDGVKLSKERTLTGNTARVIGIVCLVLALALIGGVVWAVGEMRRH